MTRKYQRKKAGSEVDGLKESCYLQRKSARHEGKQGGAFFWGLFLGGGGGGGWGGFWGGASRT